MRDTTRERASERETRQLLKENVRERDCEDTHTGDSDWQVVRGRKTEQGRKRTDVARNYQFYPKEAVRTSYFFTNFPDNFHAKQMLAAFLKYGDFEVVVIPSKRDKLGKRFGFAREVNVEDPDRFGVKLDNIIIGRNKIMVNIP